jgi:ribosome biogenesis GTPase
VIDTPGMRELQLWETDAVADTFSDIAELAAGCRFRDCRHEREPDCAVKQAVERGDISAGRYESYLKLQAEQHEIDRKRTEAARQPAGKRGQTSEKAARKVPKR